MLKPITNNYPDIIIKKSIFIKWNGKKIKYIPCISIMYRPTILLLLAMVPRDVDVDANPVFRSIFVVCVRSSRITLSSEVAGRANGHMND